MIRLFSSDKTSFTDNGIGILSDAASCDVRQELNGQYELEMQYPVEGLHFGEIALRSIITAPVDNLSEDQPFRVYRMTKPINGIVTIYARHLAYDLSGYVDSAFTADSLGLALQGLKANAVPAGCPFTFGTNKSVASVFSVDAPASVWSLLGGTQGSILDVYAGEWEFDRLSCYLWQRRGADRGVTIRYGKNMTDYQQDMNCEAVYTAVYPYWKNGTDSTVVTLTEKIVEAPGTYDFTRIMPLDLSDAFEDQPTEAQLRTRAERYISANQIGVPDVSWKVDFVRLEDSAEFPESLIETVTLGDTVAVEFERFSVSASARVVAAVFNALPGVERFSSITLGSVKSNLADTIVSQEKEIEQKPSRTLVEQISDALTVSLLGALGGAVRLLDTNGDGMPDELYIADNANPALAQKVWRFNYNGWAASTNGYSGPFTMGATLADGLLADFVTAANLTAGTIQSADGQSFYLNLNTNTLRMAAISNLDSQTTSRINSALSSANSYTDAQITAESNSVDQKIASEASNTDAKISNATGGISAQVSALESSTNQALIPLNELLNYLQVGNIGTEQNPVYGVKIGKVDLATAFKSIFTATALEFYENNIRVAFLSNQKLNANTVRTSALELVESANMADESAVDWLVTLDNGYTIKYVGS